MKKQLFLVALTFGLIATTECKKHTSIPAGGSMTFASKKKPKVKGGSVTCTGKKRSWTCTNNGATAVHVKYKK